MIIVFHPGYNPNATPPTQPVAADVVGVFEGSPELCERLIQTWSATEQDFRLIARCASRSEADQVIRDGEYRLL